MARKILLSESIQPTLQSQRAIELLRRQLDQFDKLNLLRRDDPELKKWITTTEGVLHAAFGQPNGEPHDLTARFTRRHGALYMNMTDAFYEGEHHKSMLQRKAVLESCIEQLEILAPQAVLNDSSHYRFHPEIERVSGQLYRDGHYKQASLEAYIRVIEDVRTRSGLALDVSVIFFL